MNNYQNTNPPSNKVAHFAKWLHDFAPILKEEHDKLQTLNERKPNKIFPIKIKALEEITNAAKPLYEWYVEKAKQ